MKKILSIFLASVMIASTASAALAEEAAETTTSDAAVDLFASVDGIMFEYDNSASTELERVVKVKYNSRYFTTGISRFNAEISIPNTYVSNVSYTSKLSGISITDSYSGGVYKCTGIGGENRIPSDGLLFTMKIALKESIVTPITIALTGDSYLGDSTGITQYLSNGGMNPQSLELPRGGDPHTGGDVDGAVTWTYSDGILTISGNGTMKDYDPYTDPAPWSDKPAKEVVFKQDRLDNIGANAFYGMSGITSITLSRDIITIGESAFEGCSSLANDRILEDSSVTGLGDNAFKGCSSLRNLTVPGSVESIGKGAFEGCTGLTSITLPFVGGVKQDGAGKHTFAYIFNGNVPSSLKTVTITDEAHVPKDAFANCSEIEAININDSVSVIGNGAFQNCSSLKTFKLPLSVTEISDNLFAGCSSLSTVDITDKVTQIGAAAFDGCSSLLYVYVPRVPAINDYTFRGCSSLETIIIPNSVTTIGAGILEGCKGLQDITVPFVGANANPGGTSVTDAGIFGYFFGVTDNSLVPASVTKVTVDIADRSGYIPKAAFKGCGNIVDIFVNGGRNVLDEAFANCYNLQNIVLPTSLSTIGENILANCTRLEAMTVPFIGTDRRDTNKPTSVLGGFFGYDNTNQTNVMQYYNENGDYNFYKIPRTLKKVSILNQTNIPVGAFCECDFIEEVAIASGASMGKQAFYHCAELKKVTLPNDLQTIGDEAFAECENLETINIPTKVRTIGSQVFYNDRKLRNVTMPDSVTEIAEDVFNGTDMYGSEVSLMSSALTITCTAGSAAEAYAQRKGIATNIVTAEEIEKVNNTVAAQVMLDSTGKYNVVVTDPNGISGATVYAAAYDRNGIALAAGAGRKDAEANAGCTITLDTGNGSVDNIKVFVWDSHMKPLIDGVVELTGTDIPG